MKITRTIFCIFLGLNTILGQNTASKPPKDITFSVNAYSFADVLSAREPRDKQQVYSYFNLLDWCATQNIKAIDATAYFFPTYPAVPSDEYLEKFKNHAKKLGIALSGTGIRNNFASPDPKVRAADVQLTKNWIIAASKMGAPMVRVFDGAIPKGYENKWEEPAQWMIECYKECAEFGAKYGVKIGIQNHGEMLQTSAQCKYILEKVDSKWCGLILDTGNFKTADPYKDIAEMVPYAINWQVKESVFEIGSTIKTDYKKLMKIIINGGYKGYLPVETLLVRGQPYDPFNKVPDMLKEMKQAMKEVISAQDSLGEGFAYEQNARLGRGVNVIGYDPLWKDASKARMKDKHFKLIHEVGFDNVRLVMMPFKFSQDTVNYTLNPAFFTTLDWAIKEALANKLMVIVDFHEHNAIQKNPLGNKAKLLAMWQQIATHCKDYPNEVLFEICNEPNMSPKIWNEIQMAAFPILRASNPTRTIILDVINGNQIKHLKDLELPKNDKNIIAAIHYYSPIQFTHQGAPWSVKNKDLSGIEWTNTAAAEQAINADFDTAQDWSKANNVPLTLGEFGAYDKADMPSRVRWTDYVARQAEARHWSWSYWQFDSDFIVYDMKTDEWVLPIKNALIPEK